MPTDTTFRLSTYLTLALACVCVGYAESEPLWEVPLFTLAAVAMMIALYRGETRYEYLSIPAANRLGVVIGLVYLAWASIRVVSGLRKDTFARLEIQALIVMLLGPLLIMLIPAKLARRDKHVGDYWGLHAAGLAAAGLSGAIAENTVSFILIGLYAIAAIWSITLFHLRRAAGSIPPIPGRPAPPRVASVVGAERVPAGFRAALGLAILATVIALPAYLLTPRSSGDKMDFGKPRVEIGYAADQMIDLNQTGDLEANDQVAFEVTAEVDGAPKRDLSLEQRWRGRVLRRYANGSWQSGDIPLPGVDSVPRTHAPATAKLRSRASHPEVFCPALPARRTPGRPGHVGGRGAASGRHHQPGGVPELVLDWGWGILLERPTVAVLATAVSAGVAAGGGCQRDAPVPVD